MMKNILVSLDVLGYLRTYLKKNRGAVVAIADYQHRNNIHATLRQKYPH